MIRFDDFDQHLLSDPPRVGEALKELATLFDDRNRRVTELNLARGYIAFAESRNDRPGAGAARAQYHFCRCELESFREKVRLRLPLLLAAMQVPVGRHTGE